MPSPLPDSLPCPLSPGTVALVPVWDPTNLEWRYVPTSIVPHEQDPARPVLLLRPAVLGVEENVRRIKRLADQLKFWMRR